MLLFLLACDPESPKESTPTVDQTDTDGDGLPDDLETQVGTDPTVADTDGDGLSDGDELTTYHTNPISPDSDGDGLTDGDEATAGTDLSNADTDGDGFSDAAELEAGTDPLRGRPGWRWPLG